MKKQLFFICVLITGILSMLSFTGTVTAQTAIPNGNFETWDSATFLTPMYYPYTADGQSFFQTLNDTIPNVTRVPGYGGDPYAVQLTTTVIGNDTSAGFFVDINANGSPYTWTGGMAYNQEPFGIQGYYKSNVLPGDTALIFVAFSKAGVNIGTYVEKIAGVQPNWTLFSLTFSPPLTQTPDSVAFGATSSNIANNNFSGIPGSSITLDSIGFAGDVYNPVNFNGDFELWQSQTLFKPASWYYNGDRSGDGMSRTTDAMSGKYAIELTTYLGNSNNQPAAQSGQISTGYYPNNCDSNCNELGGYPFASQIDTLAFYYKYAPQGTDSAVVEINFKKNGVQIWGNAIFLPGTGNSYVYMDFPFDIGQTPDSVIINIQSSNWNDTAVSYVGSALKIDNIYFKSQATLGIKEVFNNPKIILYPNPFQTTATLEIDAQTDLQDMQLRMYDVFGRVIKTMAVTDYKTTLGKDNLSAGVYFYEVTNNNGILKTGKIIIE